MAGQVQIPEAPLTSWVALDQWLSLSVPQFSPVQSEDTSGAYPRVKGQIVRNAEGRGQPAVRVVDQAQ